MKEPCMCGDPYCHFCGPDQGNFKCYYCGAWTFDGGCKNPEKCEALAKAEDELMELIKLQQQEIEDA